MTTPSAHDYMVKAASGYQRYQHDRQTAVAAYLEGGKALIEARKLAQHGAWLPLLAEFEIPERTVQRMMRLAEQYGDDIEAVIKAGGIRAADEALGDGKSATVADLPEDSDDIDPGQDSPPLATPEEMAGAPDDLESENYELRQEVARLRDDAPREDKPPTRTERLEAERDALAMEREQLAQRVDELKEQVRFLRGEESEHPHEREAAFNSYRAEISALRAELATERQAHNELKQAYRGAIRRIRQLEEQIEETDTDAFPGPDDDYPLSGTAEEEYWDNDYLQSLPADDQPDPDREEGVVPSSPKEPDPYEEAQWLGGFRVGHYIVTDSGNVGVIQGVRGDRLAVGLDYGNGEMVLLAPEQVKHEEEA